MMRGVAGGSLAAAVVWVTLGWPLRAESPVPPPRAVTNSIGMKLVPIPGGKFVMGMPKTEEILYGNEAEHEVEITRAFHLGACEVTQGQYERVMGRNPSDFSPTGRMKAAVAGMDTKQFPVEGVEWAEAVEFCKRLSAMPGEAGAGRAYRLPTEAEWEYACRAGTTTRFAFGDELTLDRANFDGRFLNRGPAPRGRSGPDVQGRVVPAERLGAVRHARERLGVVRRLVPAGLLREEPEAGPAGPGGGE